VALGDRDGAAAIAWSPLQPAPGAHRHDDLSTSRDMVYVAAELVVQLPNPDLVLEWLM
jgi:hypothetical protein